MCIFGPPKVTVFDSSRVYKRRAVERIGKTENMRAKRRKAETGKKDDREPDRVKKGQKRAKVNERIASE